ncbi:hypothetical protein FP2506_01773 [Fulvimarina pelagi HTCC2506]|uniref:Uncharacterized protein n=1 Tax=Fulvimarina pelagi HTCC2506 TaxID=314231 RepID=Q0FXI0_9HYPH|nr:hypothetical protein FP2506_01773 [Fulvimarina pelagi HTCC2506]
MTRSGSGWRFAMRLPRQFHAILSHDSTARSCPEFVRASFGPMTVRDACLIGE